MGLSSVEYNVSSCSDVLGSEVDSTSRDLIVELIGMDAIELLEYVSQKKEDRIPREKMMQHKRIFS